MTPAIHTASREAQALYRRVGRFFRKLGRRPQNPWRRFDFIDPKAYAGTLMWGNRYRPLRLKCETVNTCNNLCVICSYPLNLRKKHVMSLDLFEKVLSDYSDIGGGYLSLTPVTGDILLDKHLLERLEIVKRHPAIREIGVTTNAAMLDRFSDSEVRTIVQSFGKLQISVYGLDEEEYFAMTQRKTYQRAVDGIRRIAAVGTGNVYLAFRLLKQRPVQELQAWRVAIGAQNTHVNSIMMGGYANFLHRDTSIPLPYGAPWLDSVPQTKKSQCLVLSLGSASLQMETSPSVLAWMPPTIS